MAAPTFGDVQLTTSFSGTSIAVAEPTDTGLGANDRIGIVGAVATTNSTVDLTMAAPWVRHELSASFPAGGFEVRYAAFSATGSDVDGTGPFTISLNGTSIVQARIWSVSIFDTGGFDGFASKIATGTPDTLEDVVTSVDECAVFATWGKNGGTTTNPPTGYSTLFGPSSNSYAWQKEQAVAGSTGNPSVVTASGLGTHSVTAWMPVPLAVVQNVSVGGVTVANVLEGASVLGSVSVGTELIWEPTA